MPVDPQPEPPKTNPWALALGAGLELVVSVLLGFFLGRWADGTLGTGPWLMLLGAMTGICVGLYQLIRAAGRAQADRQKRG